MKKDWRLIQVIKISSQDIGVEFDLEKSAMLITKSRKREMMEGIELPNQERIRTPGELETYKNLGILEANTIKKSGDEIKNRKNKKEYLRRTRNFLETKICSRNIIKGINIWAVQLLRYSGPFLK